MVPNVKVNKTDGNTAVVSPSSKGICAIIAPCSSGTANQASAHTKESLAVAEFGNGILTEGAAYMLSVTGNPVVLVRATASTAGTYNGSVTHTGAGTSVATATVGAPYDDFEIVVKFLTGGTIGVAGITYQVSLDNGKTYGAVLSLGTANTIAPAGTGATLSLAAGTILAGQTEAFKTTGPRLTAGDITTALEALRVSSQPWEMVLILGHDATATTITNVDAWLSGLETSGKFRGFLMNTAMKGSTAEATFATAQSTAYGASATIRGGICADGGELPSLIPGRAGYVIGRPAALAVMARLMKISYGTDAAYVNDGVVPGFKLPDAKGNPNFHDENLFPTLSDLRLTALRTFDRRAGTYINDPLVLSPSGSDYVYLQHVRVMNRACEIAYDILTGELSRGVLTNPKPGPTGQIYIAEEAAQEIDDLVSMGLNELRSEVTAIDLVLSRTDDIGSNGPALVTSELFINGKRYIKQFTVNSSFVRTISTQA